MKEEQKVIAFDAYEEGAIIEGLNKIRTEQLEKEGAADFVSDLMLKILHSPPKKVRVRDEAR
jgi:sulfur transfer protein SufE